MDTQYKNPTTGVTVNQEGRTPQDLANQGFMPITAESLKPQPAINLAPYPTDTSATGAGILAGGTAMMNAFTGANQAAQQNLQNQQNNTPSIADMMKSLGVENPTPTDPTVAYNDAYNQSGVGTAQTNQINSQAAFDAINAQLQGITADATAQKLSLQGQAAQTGTTATTGDFLNRQQNEIDRQAAIKALPLQSLALVKQAELTQNTNLLNAANDKLNTLYKLKSDYNTQLYNYNKDNYDRIWNYLTDKEKEQVAQNKADEQRKYDKTQSDLAYARTLSNAAMANGQGDLAAKIGQLDENSPSYLEDLANLQKQITTTKKLETSVIQSGGKQLLIDNQTGKTIADLGQSDDVVKSLMEKFPDAGITQSDSVSVAQSKLQNSQIYQASISKVADAKIIKINGVDYQQNPDGSFTAPDLPEATKQATDLQNQAGASAQALLDKLINGKGTSAVGTSRIFQIQRIPGTAAYDFEVQFNNLKSLLSLDNVKLLKGQGQVSDAERKLLAEASAKLDLGQSEAEFKKSLQDVAVVLGNPGDIQVKSDNTYIYKNLDGTIHKGKQGDNYKDITQPKLNLDFSTVGGDTNKAIARTDRHNNPTAFTTDIAKAAGLKEGVDYTKGDSFSNGQYNTAKLLKDPIDTTIKVIDKLGFTTASGKPRWTYINLSKTQWDKMSYDQKKNTIKKMYQNEGGSNLNNLFA
jgi:hypothetical protein